MGLSGDLASSGKDRVNQLFVIFVRNFNLSAFYLKGGIGGMTPSRRVFLPHFSRRGLAQSGKIG
jgi:hypothetical protein